MIIKKTYLTIIVNIIFVQTIFAQSAGNSIYDGNPFFQFIPLILIVLIVSIFIHLKNKKNSKLEEEFSGSKSKNKVVRIELSGGIGGLIFTNPRRALANKIYEENEKGWICHQIMPHIETNIIVKILQILVLIFTLFLWTWGAGYMVLFKKSGIKEDS